MPMSTALAPSCYQCDATATGREHVPPKCLFPRNMDRSRLITVPSCSKHNNDTSQADEYLKFLLGAIASDVPPSIIASAARGAVRLAEKRSRNIQRFGFKWDEQTLVIGNEFTVDIELLRAGLEKMARALYFDHHGGHRKLRIPLHVLPLFLPVDNASDVHFRADVERLRSQTAQDMERYPKAGGHQQIFAYQMFESSTTVMMNMQFYGGHHAAVVGLFQATGDA